MAQPLSYWAGNIQPLTPCNSYRLLRLDDEILWGYWANYIDCWGVQQTVNLAAPSQPEPSLIDVCSNTLPTLHTSNPLGVGAGATVTLVGPCESENTPESACCQDCDGVYYYGNYVYPLKRNILLGTGTGSTALQWSVTIGAAKFIAKWNNTIVLDSGYYVGSVNPYTQTELNARLASKGLPPETIAGTGSNQVFFNKTTSSPQILEVEAFVPGTAQFRFWGGCPPSPGVINIDLFAIVSLVSSSLAHWELLATSNTTMSQNVSISASGYFYDSFENQFSIGSGMNCTIVSGQIYGSNTGNFSHSTGVSGMSLPVITNAFSSPVSVDGASINLNY